MQPSALTTTGGHQIQFSAHGLSIRGEMTLDEWKNLLRLIGSAKSAYHCILADHLNYGRKRFGDAEVAVALEQEEFDLADVTKATAIGQLTLDFRERKPLTAEHYFVLSKVESKTLQDKWASIAVSQKLSALELKRSIEAGRILRQNQIEATSGQGSGINTIHGVMFKFQQWQRDMGGNPKILELPKEDLQNLLQLLTPTIELAAEIEQLISQPSNPTSDA